MVTGFFVESHWLDICNTTPATGQVGPGVPRRAVLIPELSAEPTIQMIQVRVEFENGGFFGEDAARAAARIMGTEPEDAALGYSHALGGYVVLEGDFSWFLKRVAQVSRGRRLPSLPLDLLRDIDATGSVIVRVGERQEGFGPESWNAGWEFGGVHPVFYGDGMYTRGEFIELNETNLRGFLAQARRRRRAITQRRCYFRSRYFVLVLSGENGQ